MLGAIRFKILVFRHEPIGDAAVVGGWLKGRLTRLGMLRFFEATSLLPSIAMIIFSTLKLLLLAEFSLSVEN